MTTPLRYNFRVPVPLTLLLVSQAKALVLISAISRILNFQATNIFKAPSCPRPWVNLWRH